MSQPWMGFNTVFCLAVALLATPIIAQQEELSTKSSQLDQTAETAHACDAINLAEPCDAFVPCSVRKRELDATSSCERAKFTGNWLGYRDCFSQSGVVLDGSSTSFYNGVTTGGRERGFFFGSKLDGFVNIDTDKLVGWQGGSLTIHGESRFGETSNEHDGSYVPTNAALYLPNGIGVVSGLTAFKYTQALSENFALFGGKINTLDDYDVNFIGRRGLTGFQSSALVANSSLARIVPYSTYGAGAAILVDKQPFATLSVMDPTDYSTQSGLDQLFSNGATVVGQVRIPVAPAGLPGRQILGAAYSSGRFATLEPTSYLNLPPAGGALPTEKGSWGLFWNADQYLVTSAEDPKRGWGLFWQSGIADGNPSPVDWYFSTGIGGSSWLRSRPNDTFGVGVFHVALSSEAKRLSQFVVPLENEQGGEIFYNIAATPWFHITPNLIAVDSGVQIRESPLLVGLRAKIDF